MSAIVHNWVFPKWLSLNSVNHDQIQEQYGYQRHSISDNRYIPWYSSKKNFPLLSVVWYLFRVMSGNKYLPQDSNENALCITSTDNVYVARWVIPMVTILLLHLVMIHWICSIQGKSFWENSNIFVDISCNICVLFQHWHILILCKYLYLCWTEIAITRGNQWSKWCQFDIKNYW